MEAAFEWVLMSSPLLVALALLQRSVSRAGAIFAIAILIGVLTTLLAFAPGGLGDAAMGRGWLVIYGTAACFVVALIAAWSFMASAPRMGAASRDKDGESDSVEMFNRATQSDEIDR